MAWVGCALAALLLLLRPAVVIGAASQACALFAASVLPGLYPYMILLLLLPVAKSTKCLPESTKWIIAVRITVAAIRTIAIGTISIRVSTIRGSTIR